MEAIGGGAASGSSSRRFPWVWIAGCGGVGCVVLVMLLVALIGIGIRTASRSIGGGDRAGRAFLQAVLRGGDDAALRMVSPSGNRSMAPADYRRLFGVMRSEVGAVQTVDLTGSSVNVRNGVTYVRLQYEVTGARGRRTVRMTLVQERGALRVRSCEMSFAST